MQINTIHDRILQEVDIRAEPFAICALEGACSMGLGRLQGATLHYVLGGEGRLSVQSRPALPLAPGRLVLVPAATLHSLRHDGERQTGLPACKPAGLNLKEHIRRGEGRGNMIVLCSSISLGLRNTHGLIDLLRAPLSFDVTTSDTAHRAMQSLIDEMLQPRAGRRAMVRVLLLQCVIEMLRVRLSAEDPAVMWIAALADPGLLEGLRAMLDDPGAAHSLESLAQAAGMSRSRFAARFQAAYGAPPMRFLRELRLARAAQLLAERREPVKRIARMVGFDSRSAFTRAFTASRGISPRAFRTGDSD